MEIGLKIKGHYGFTVKDEARLRAVSPIMSEYGELCINHLHRQIEELGDTAVLKKIKTARLHKIHLDWFLGLFSGTADLKYYTNLSNVGYVHSKMGINPHFVNVAISIVRDYSMKILATSIEDNEELMDTQSSLNKILDINLDLITSSYLEEQMEHLSSMYRVKGTLLRFAENFSSFMNLILVLLLICLTIGVVGLFFYDLAGLIRSNLSQGLISALGSLIVLWVMIELMNTEIDHIKGGTFNISVFIGVALVTFIRDLLITTLKHEALNTGYYMMAVILVLGLVYWLIKRTETKERSQ
ncbi:MAG: phosphate-starvation-inducible PsiE family protein [Nitrospirae bacterium]|nr:phosphate-starvation-inducible PsiE family protein [Nitrospirota bacterium]